jgi:hypothetical protein
MIRRDYVLGMIEDFARALARIRSFRAGEKWEEADAAVLAEFKKLIGEDGCAVAKLSEMELMAAVVREGPTLGVGHRALLLATLLQEAAEIAEGRGQAASGRQLRLKALHLLLEILGRGEISDWPQFVPTIDMMAAGLGSAAMPARTLAMLMAHYERAGEYAKAEDAFCSILDLDPGNRSIIDFGQAFYRRMLAQTDDDLVVGNLPREEVNEGLDRLERKPTLNANAN